MPHLGAGRNSGMPTVSQGAECSVLLRNLVFFLEMCLTKTCLVLLEFAMWRFGLSNATFAVRVKLKRTKKCTNAACALRRVWAAGREAGY